MKRERGAARDWKEKDEDEKISTFRTNNEARVESLLGDVIDLFPC